MDASFLISRINQMYDDDVTVKVKVHAQVFSVINPLLFSDEFKVIIPQISCEHSFTYEKLLQILKKQIENDQSFILPHFLMPQNNKCESFIEYEILSFNGSHFESKPLVNGFKFGKQIEKQGLLSSSINNKIIDANLQFQKIDTNKHCLAMEMLQKL